MIRNPDSSIENGYDIHVVFASEQSEKATDLFTAFMDFVLAKKIAQHRSKVFLKPVGPWPTPMWQVLLPQSERVHHDLGLCLGWLMLNRGEFSVMIHPNTRKENGFGGDYEDHHQNMLWLGPSMSLKLDIFAQT